MSTSENDNALGESTRVTVAGSVYTRSFDAETVLLNFSSGEYFALDAIGTEVWRGCEAGETMKTIAGRIVAQYQVSYETALRDILSLIAEMRASNLVSIAP